MNDYKIIFEPSAARVAVGFKVLTAVVMKRTTSIF
jgi:hypothetical protein